MKVSSSLSVAILLLTATAAHADREGGLQGARLGLLLLDTNASTDDRTNRDSFGDRLADDGYTNQKFENLTAQQVLEQNPEVLLVIASTFHVKDGSVAVSLHWRPNGSRTIKPVGENKNAIADVAVESIRFIESEIISQLRDYERTLPHDECDEKIYSAWDAFNNGDFQAAKQQTADARKMSTNENQRFRTVYLHGLANMKLGELPEALDDFQSLYDSKQSDDSALLQMGIIEFLQGHLQKAEGHYLSVQERHDVNAIKATWNLVLLYQSQGRMKEALDQIKALPDNSTHRYDSGEIVAAINGELTRMQKRNELVHQLLYVLVALAVVVVVVILVTMYRRSQRSPDLTPAQRLDFAGKFMGGLFSILSLLGGTMLGVFIGSH